MAATKRKIIASIQRDLFGWSAEEDEILLRNWRKGYPLEKDLDRTNKEIENHLEVLFEQEDALNR